MKKFAEYFCALLLFLLPLKFGGLAVMPESGGYYPEFWSDWLSLSFPPHSLAFFGSAALLSALLSCREKPRKDLLIFAAVWCLLPAAAVLPGIIRGDRLIALAEISLLTGCGSLIMAAAILLNERKEVAKMFITALFAGGVVTAVYGLHQYAVDFEINRQFAAEQEAQGIPLSDAMRLKLTDTRVYSTMSSSNVLASLLLIMLTLSVYLSAQWSKKISPPKQTKIFLLIICGALFFSVLFLTRSRSAIFCPLAAGMLAVLSFPKLKIRWRAAGITAGIIIVIAGIIFAVHHGRGVASMGERADYWRTCAILCKENPAAGAGWGGFFLRHMQIKKSEVIESARDPHNVVAAFASQCGIPAGLIMLLVLVYPLAVLWKSRFDGSLRCAVFWCGVMFSVHSLIDCDWHSPAMIAAMGVLYACGIAGNDSARIEIRRQYLLKLFPSAALIITGCVSSAIYLAGDAALSRLSDKVHPMSADIAAKMAPYQIEYLVREAEKWRPASQTIPMLAGDYCMKSHRIEQAEKYYLHAMALEPRRPAPYARLARIEFLRGNRRKAEELMLKAHSLFPKSRDYTLEKLYGSK